MFCKKKNKKKHDWSKQQVCVKQQGIKDLLKNHQQDEHNFPFQWKTFHKFSVNV